jgi:hypothetical protein
MYVKPCHVAGGTLFSFPEPELEPELHQNVPFLKICTIVGAEAGAA